MDICIVTPELPPFVRGGIGTYVLDLARGYSARGHQVTIVGYRIHLEPELDHPWGKSISLDAISGLISRLVDSVADSVLSGLHSAAETLGMGRGLWRLDRMRSNAITGRLAWHAAHAVRGYLMEFGHRHDVVEMSNWLGHGAFVPPIRGKYIARVSTPSVLFGVGSMKAVTRLEARTCANARHIIAHSEAVKRSAVGYYRVDPAKVVVVPLGIADCTPPTTSPSREHVDLLHIGRAEHRKGTDLLLRAMAAVLPNSPALRITIASADVDTFVSVDAELATIWRGMRATYGDRIRVLPPVTEAEKIDLIAKSHWVLVPSRYESFGLVAVESMRGGTPVIAADVGGLAEVCARVATSRTFAPGDWRAFAVELEAGAQLGAGPALALRPATRAGYEEWFRSERMVDESLAVYERAIED